MNETELNAEVRLATYASPTWLFRNNTGKLRDRKGRLISFGLAKGSHDLIGWMEYVIRPEDVGKPVAVFVSLESKGRWAKTTDAQVNWQNAVRAAGGISAGIKRVDSAPVLLNCWRPGFHWGMEGPWITLTSPMPSATGRRLALPSMPTDLLTSKTQNSAE